MANRVHKKIKLVRTHSNPLTKMAVAVAIVLSMAALLSLMHARQESIQRVERLQTQTAQLTEENQQLNRKISMLGTRESTERIAQEELGMAWEGTVFFQPKISN